MTLQLTPEALAAAYDYLRTTLPFRRWSLPPASEVEFCVTQHKGRFGDHTFFNGRHTIRVSTRKVGRTASLMETVAHEAVHVYCAQRGIRSGHGAEFWKGAALVCRHHGFDEKTF